MGKRASAILVWVLSAVPLRSQGTISINPGGVVNAADYAAQVAPCSIAAVFGNFMTASPLSGTSFPLPTSLAGLSFGLYGSCPPGPWGCPLIVLGSLTPLFYVSSDQVNLQVPWGWSASEPQWQNTMVAYFDVLQSSPQVVNVVPFAPAIFSIDSRGSGQGAILDSSYRLVDQSNPVGAGAGILIYCTGLGQVTNQPAAGAPALSNPLSWATTIPVVTIGGVASDVSFYGLAPGYVGLYQVNARVPEGLPVNEATPVTLSIGGAQSNTVTIAVE